MASTVLVNLMDVMNSSGEPAGVGDIKCIYLGWCAFALASNVLRNGAICSKINVCHAGFGVWLYRLDILL